MRQHDQRALETLGDVDELEGGAVAWCERAARCDDMLAVAPLADPYVGPDRKALEVMLAGFERAAPTG